MRAALREDVTIAGKASNSAAYFETTISTAGE
jgi:hypothetical protein